MVVRHNSVAGLILVYLLIVIILNKLDPDIFTVFSSNYITPCHNLTFTIPSTSDFHLSFGFKKTIYCPYRAEGLTADNRAYFALPSCSDILYLYYRREILTQNASEKKLHTILQYVFDRQLGHSLLRSCLCCTNK